MRGLPITRFVTARPASPAPAGHVDLLSRRRDQALVAAFLSGAGGRLVTPFFGALAVAVATRALGETRYGVVATLGSMMGLLIFVDLGVGNAFVTRLSVAYGRHDPLEMRTIVSSAWVMLLAAGSVVVTAGIVVSVAVPWPDLLGAPDLPDGDVRSAVLAMLSVVAVGVPSTLGQRILISLQRGALANAWAVAAAIITPGAVALTAALDAPLWAFVLSTVGVPVLIACVQTAWVLRRAYPELRPSRHHVSRHSVRPLLRVGALYLLLNLSSAVAFHADQLIVAAIQGAAAAAVFGLVVRLFRIVEGMTGTGSEQLWTVATAALTTGDVAWLRSRFLRVATLTAAATGLMCAVLALVGRPLISLWAGPGFVPPLSLLVWCAICTTYSTVASQVQFLLNAAGVVGPQAVMALSMAAVNISLSIYLTDRIGLVGPLVGSLVAHLVCYGGPALFFARRILRTPDSDSGRARS